MSYRPAFIVETDSSNGGTRLRLRGELDLSGVAAVRDALQAQDGPLVVDTTRLTFIDVSGLNALLDEERARGPEHFSLVPGDATRRLMKLVSRLSSPYSQ